jgi:hypothetical protein
MSRLGDESSRVARYAKSKKNIAGCVLAVGGPALVVLGVVAPPVGLVLTPMLYGVGALAAPARKEPVLSAGLDRHDVRRSLAEIRKRIYGRVPLQVSAKVERIANAIMDVLPRAGTLGTGSTGQHVLVRCATDYLPSTLQAYLDLPRSWADSHVVEDGKTPLKLLNEQLDLLAKEIADVTDAINRADTDKLLANGRFLAEKFGTGELDVDGPDAGEAG